MLLADYYHLPGCITGMDYRSCGVHATCRDLISVNNCTDITCVSGCFCSNGNVLDGGYCIDPGLCPGRHKTPLLAFIYIYCTLFFFLTSYFHREGSISQGCSSAVHPVTQSHTISRFNSWVWLGLGISFLPKETQQQPLPGRCPDHLATTTPVKFKAFVIYYLRKKLNIKLYRTIILFY